MKIEILPVKKEYEVLLDLYPPKIANKFLPDWYKKQKFIGHKEHHHNFWKGGDLTGAKACPAIQDLVTTGFVIPLWANFYFTTLDNGEQVYEFTVVETVQEPLNMHVSAHPKKQVADLDLQKNNEGQILKFQLPYWIKIPEGYNLLFTDPFYNFRKAIRCLSGIIEGDKWGTLAIPFEILKPEFTIMAGTPLIHVYPVKRESKKIDLINRKANDNEYYEIKKNIAKVQLTRTNYRSES